MTILLPAEPAAAPAGPTAPAVPAPPAPARSRGWRLPVAVVVVGMFMSVLDTSIVNVAISAMSKEFGSSTDQIQWVSTAYTLCLGVVVPASAW
ncbi:MAG TPA: MFS transporter, partial [Pseudonocardia sp.]|nr:MFS transporter [Pseudonocardia sp.]